MNIIAVDDERLALENLVSAIQKAVPDCALHAFRRVSEMLDFAEKHPCDVAFIDVEMREMTGVEAAEKLKVLRPRINIIFATGYSEYTGKAMEMHASGYIMKPITPEKVKHEIEELRYPLSGPEKKATAYESEDVKHIRIQAFGNFEIFYDNVPLTFQYSKTKELLAYLVDRRGSLCANAQIMSALWENEDDYMSHNSYMKNLRTDLIVSLEKVGCGDIIVRRRGVLGIVPEKVTCDYFDWCDGKKHALDSYRGEYMSQYGWSEYTHGLLEDAVSKYSRK